MVEKWNSSGMVADRTIFLGGGSGGGQGIEEVRLVGTLAEQEPSRKTIGLTASQRSL